MKDDFYDMVLFVDQFSGEDSGWTTDLMKIEENLLSIHLDPEDILETAKLEPDFQRVFGAGRYIVICKIDHAGKSARMDIYNHEINLEDHADELLDKFDAPTLHQFSEWQSFLRAQPEIDLTGYVLSDDFLSDS
ncbi:hypothetical protein SAMN05216327_101232 [Dyadobacter sp. SG02]|uniref:hypothetical protein n=1 Tax=Dyadobacter sp. SG02 TaxID=1855291 RepID=UPI0008B97410|nr:hypothetical protein [Dyadobacter sp. SG02]SEI39837.1 hypothetical protein SAMN05216327_101232 [Dyadobacter sp. SG02]